MIPVNKEFHTVNRRVCLMTTNFLINTKHFSCLWLKLKIFSSHWVHDVVSTLNQRQWRWFSVSATSCALWDHTASLGKSCYHNVHQRRRRWFTVMVTRWWIRLVICTSFQFVFTSRSLLLFWFSFFSLGDLFKIRRFNPFKPEFTIVIFIHYKPQIAVAILDL